jgi:hypothetical protein
MVQNSHSQPDNPAAVPEPERRPILLRAYAETEPEQRRGARSRKPSDWVLVFDTETKDDETQRFRFGTFQLREGERLEAQGLFFDPHSTTEAEQRNLKVEAAKRNCKLFPLAEFTEKVFFPAAHRSGATVVGFNLPFDLSRIVISYQRARAVQRRNRKGEVVGIDRSMVGGFTFTLSDREDRPNLRVKHLSRRAAFINFASAGENATARSRRNRKEKTPSERGFFLDLKTLAAALTSTSHTLDSLAEFLEVPRKISFQDFGREIDAEFIHYALNDTEVTWQCYQKLMGRFSQHQLKKTLAHQIYSEASLGKAYLREMGIKPWRQVQPDFDPKVIGAIMSSYFGGRAEAHRRREIVQTLYCDFASTYPTVCTLMGLWKFVIANGMTHEDTTAGTQAFLDWVNLADLQHSDTWQQFHVLVQVQPQTNIFPVRARYGSEPIATIGLNYLTSDRLLWFTLADCVASKLLCGKAPKVVQAIRFAPKTVQKGLQLIAIAGNDEYHVDPTTDDFYKRVIDLRRSVNKRLKMRKEQGADEMELKRLDSEQLALKILANATSYGVLSNSTSRTPTKQKVFFKFIPRQVPGRREAQNARSQATIFILFWRR